MGILITGAATSAAYRLKNKLAIEGTIMGDYAELPATMISAKMIQLPKPSSVSYAHQVLTLCLDKGIDTIYVMKEDEWMLLKEAEQLFGEYGIDLVHGP